jgi:integrase/recombinase XerD
MPILEPFGNIEKDLLYWIRQYLEDKLFSMSDRLADDSIDINRYMDDILNEDDDITSLQELTRELSQKGYKAISTYANPLYKFYFYLLKARVKNIKKIDTKLVNRYITRELHNYADSTKQTHYTIIKNFFVYIEDHGEDEENDDLPYLFNINQINGRNKNPIKKRKKLPEFLNREEFELFKDAIENYPFTSTSKINNIAMLKTLLYGGLRVGELVRIKKRDLSFVDNNIKIFVTGKGDRDRNIYIKKDLVEYEFNQLLKRDGEYLFLSPSGDKYTERAIHYIVKTTLEFANIHKNKMGPHLLRHSYASYLASSGVAVTKIQKLLGHSDISTTMIYVHIADKELESVSDVF